MFNLKDTAYRTMLFYEFINENIISFYTSLELNYFNTDSDP